MIEELDKNQGFPNHWSPHSLGEFEERGVLVIKNGFSCGTHETNGQGVPHLRPFNVTEDGRLFLNEIKTIPYKPGMGEYALQAGDILYNNTNSEELVGKCTYWSGRQGLYVLSNHMTIMRITDQREVDSEFLAFHLYWFWVTGAARLVCRRHVNQASIGLERMRQIVIQCPPLSEQRAVAAVLSKIQAAVEVREKIVATLKELKAATMAKLFREGLRGEPLKQTEIGEIPESWEVVQLGKIARIGNGSTPKRDKQEYWQGGNIPWLTSAKVHESIIEAADEHVTEMARGECHLPLVRRGSIVIAITGQGKTLGNAALVTFDTCVSQHLAYIQFETNTVLPEFMLSFLQGQYQYFRQVSQSGGSTKGALTCGFLKGCFVPLPSLEEQRQIAKTLSLLGTRLKREESRWRSLKSLFSSMLHLLMTGQVRVTQKMIALQALEERKKRQKKYTGKIDEKKLQEIVRRIVEAVQPEKIILFGSAARSEMGPDSDVDLLVVKACHYPREMQRLIYRKLIGVGIPKDIIVVTPQHLEKHKGTIGYIYRPALREGKVLYAK